MSTEKPTILVVDDTPDNLTLLSGLLRDFYKVKVATSGVRALAICRDTPPDLILLDVMMPDMDGYQTIIALKQDGQLADIPVIFLTAKTEQEDEAKGLALGAVDYITKPVNRPIMLSRVRTHLTLKQARDFLKGKNEYLEAEINRRLREIALIKEVSIVAMASLAETRDNETGSHLHRTQQYMRTLAVYLQKHERFRGFLTDDNIELLVKSAPLHDIGKVGIPDHILLKPEGLTQEEFEIMKRHAEIGLEAIERAEKIMGNTETFLSVAKEIAYSHHEKWNGSGYPQGLVGEKIPISARLMAVADVYDALISKRVYKQAFPHEMAVAIIREGAGEHFDPAVVEAFLALEKVFLNISQGAAAASAPEEDIHEKSTTN